MLVVTLSETTREIIKENLFCKTEIKVFENESLVDTFYNFTKPISITERLEEGTFIVTLKHVSELEERLELLEEAFNEMLFSEEVV